MKRMFKSERHFALAKAFPSDLLSSGAMQGHEPKRRRRASRWPTVALAVAAIVGLAVVCTKARAEQLVVGVHMGTAHFSGEGLNGVNPGLYVHAPSCATAGFYLNSHKRMSVYAGCTLQAAPFALLLGAVTGYAGQALTVMVVPSVRIPLPAAALRVAYIPKPMKHGTTDGVHLSIEKEF